MLGSRLTDIMAGHRRKARLGEALLCLLGMAGAAGSAAQSETAGQLIDRVLSNRLSSFSGHARLVRFDAKTGKEETKRLVLKVRREGNTTKVLYQIVSPAPAAGQAVLLELEDKRPARGVLVEGPDRITSLTPRIMEQPFFGSDLRIEDLTDDFLHWPDPEIVGNEMILGCLCRIIESRPPAGTETGYLLVRSGVCPRMALPLRVERVGRDAKLTRTLKVERAAKADRDHWTARSLSVTLPDRNSRTLLEGTSFDRDAIVPAADFELKVICAAFKQSPDAKGSSRKVPHP